MYKTISYITQEWNVFFAFVIPLLFFFICFFVHSLPFYTPTLLSTVYRQTNSNSNCWQLFLVGIHSLACNCYVWKSFISFLFLLFLNFHSHFNHFLIDRQKMCFVFIFIAQSWFDLQIEWPCLHLKSCWPLLFFIE